MGNDKTLFHSVVTRIKLELKYIRLSGTISICSIIIHNNNILFLKEYMITKLTFSQNNNKNHKMPFVEHQALC